MGVSINPNARNRALSLGAAGETWLAQLEETVQSLLHRWEISLGRTFPEGTSSFAAEVFDHSGIPFVLKLFVPEDAQGYERSVRLMEAARGKGYARVLQTAPEHQAVLLERLGCPLRNRGLPVEEQVAIVCKALSEVWQPAGPDCVKPGEMFQWFRRFLPECWQALGRPCSENIIQKAIDYLLERELALEDQPLFLLHGDANNTNLLEDPQIPGSYKFIDPDGFCGEKAYDLGVLQREWMEEYEEDPVGEGLQRLELLHRLTGAPRRAIWQWGYIQCVSTGLVCLQIRYGDTGQRLLDVAEKWYPINI